jgi:nucleotide-binding universal stress UspA family protein
MNANAASPIIVGLDGSDLARTAMAWAADEARRRHAPLLIVHAADLDRRTAISEPTAYRVMREVAEYGADLVADAKASIGETHPDVIATSLIREGGPADLLVKLSNDAQLVVVGSHGEGRFVGALLGSTSQRVAARANCDVVVVNPADYRVDHGVVVVGVSSGIGGAQALRFAFDEARLRGADVVAVHSWSDMEVWNSIGMGYGGPTFEDLRTAGDATARFCVNAVSVDYPDVVVRVMVEHAAPETALLAAAEVADLLVVGCAHSDDFPFSRLGRIASSILHRAPCPVVVVGRASAATPSYLAATPVVAAV